MNEISPVTATLDMIGRTCPLCRMPVQAGSAVMVCQSCKSPHHATCWEKSGGCGAQGCSQARATVAPSQPQPTMVSQPRPQPTVMGQPPAVAVAGQGSCPKCGYVYGPMETTCKRCAGGAPIGGPAGPRPELPRRPYEPSGGGFPWTMVVIVLISLGLIGGVVYLATGGGVREGAIRIEYKFKAAQTDKYDVSATVSMNMPTPAGPKNIDAQVTANLVQKVLSVLPDGGAKIEIGTKNMKITSAMIPSGRMPSQPDESHIVTISKTGKTSGSWQQNAFSNLSMPGMSMGGANALGAGAILPDQGVDVGQTWSQKVPLVKDIQMDVTSTLLTDSEMVDGHKCCKIEQKYDLDMDLVEAMKASGEAVPAGVNGRVKLSGNGLVFFSVDEGRLVKQDAKFNMEMNLKGGGPHMGGLQEMNMKMDITALTVLAK